MTSEEQHCVGTESGEMRSEVLDADQTPSLARGWVRLARAMPRARAEVDQVYEFGVQFADTFLLQRDLLLEGVDPERDAVGMPEEFLAQFRIKHALNGSIRLYVEKPDCIVPRVKGVTNAFPRQALGRRKGDESTARHEDP